jgi:hypothetical protein
MRAAKPTKGRKSNPERKQWRKRRDLLIDVFGSVSRAAVLVGCHPNSLRNIDTCPGKKSKLAALLAKKGEVLP